MRLLFDQNLSFRLVETVGPAFSGSKHVRDLGLMRASDADVWSFARAHEYAIASKDSDFANLAFLHGQPPKLIYVRLGNCSTERIAAMLNESRATLCEFLDDPIASVLTLR